MGIVSWLLLGSDAGALAKFFTPSKDPSGWVVTIVLGICGTLVGGFIGTVVLLLGYRVISK